MWHVLGRREMCGVFWWGNLKENNHLEDLGEVRSVQRVLKKQDWGSVLGYSGLE
jgi:hypothetical protein